MNTRIGGLLAAVIMLAATPALAASGQWPLGATESLIGALGMRLLVLWLCAGVGALVYVAMILAIVGSGRGGPRRTAVEVAWLVLVAAIMIGTALPAAREVARDGQEAVPALRVAIPAPDGPASHGPAAQPMGLAGP